MMLIALYNRYVGPLIALLGLVAMLGVFLYVALLLGTIAHAAGAASAQRELRATAASVGALESRFLAETKAITPQRAALLGFVKPTEVATIMVGASALTLRY